MTATNTVSATVVANTKPTEAQLNRLQTLNYTGDTTRMSRSEVSQLISKLISDRDMQPATAKQLGRAGVLGGRDLPGAGVREVSSQIALLEALIIFETADEDGKADAAKAMAEAIRARFVKQGIVYAS